MKQEIKYIDGSRSLHFRYKSTSRAFNPLSFHPIPSLLLCHLFLTWVTVLAAPNQRPCPLIERCCTLQSCRWPAVYVCLDYLDLTLELWNPEDWHGPFNYLGIAYPHVPPLPRGMLFALLFPFCFWCATIWIDVLFAWIILWHLDPTMECFETHSLKLVINQVHAKEISGLQ